MAKDIFVEVISPDQWTAFGWISSAFEQSKIIQHHYSIFNHLKLIYLSKFNLSIQIVCLISDGILRNRNPYMPIYFLQIIVQVLTYHEAE